jgi:hypothetical protein
MTKSISDTDSQRTIRTGTITIPTRDEIDREFAKSRREVDELFRKPEIPRKDRDAESCPPAPEPVKE